jgi:hypothetical protein
MRRLEGAQVSGLPLAKWDENLQLPCAKCYELEVDLSAIAVGQRETRRSNKINMSRAVRP